MKNEMPIVKCLNCRSTVYFDENPNLTRCGSCGFNFRGELVEIEWVSLEDLIEEELGA